MEVDVMHDRIIQHNLTPTTIPHGARIMKLMPQIPCSFEYFDRSGNPVCIEYYGFPPGEIYLTFI
jgi:hypothetical protein